MLLRWASRLEMHLWGQNIQVNIIQPRLSLLPHVLHGYSLNLGRIRGINKEILSGPSNASFLNLERDPEVRLLLSQRS
jgi:hypothetical protein